MAAFDYFLRIDGIPGESADDKHKGEIEVETFSWGESQAAAGSSGSGGGAGRVTLHDLHFTAAVSKASPMLMLACASGQHLKSAVVSARRTAKQPADFLTFSLSDVLVSGYAITASEDGPPTDSVSLNFSRIQLEYKAQKADGSLGASTKAGWDAKTGKQV
jgi:type VI secretion system secreted protein Hcp